MTSNTSFHNSNLSCWISDMGRKGRLNTRYKTKNRSKDLDEVNADMQPGQAEKLLNQEFDPDLPGGGQNYCVVCAKHFIDRKTLNLHRRSKPHKRRLKVLEEDPFSPEEASAAAGKGQYEPPRKRQIVDPGIADETEKQMKTSD